MVDGGSRTPISYTPPLRFLGSWLGEFVQPESFHERALVDAFVEIVSTEVSLENSLALLWTTSLSPTLLTSMVVVALEVLVPGDMENLECDCVARHGKFGM